MIHRILDAWPYVAAIVAGFLSWPAVMNLPFPPEWPMMGVGVGMALIYLIYPLALLIGALVLGFRRGYDWVTLLVCLAIYVGWPTVTNLLTGGDWESHWTNWGMATAAFFIPATQAGILLGMWLRRLSRDRASLPLAEPGK